MRHSRSGLECILYETGNLVLEMQCRLEKSITGLSWKMGPGLAEDRVGGAPCDKKRSHKKHRHNIYSMLWYPGWIRETYVICTGHDIFTHIKKVTANFQKLVYPGELWRLCSGNRLSMCRLTIFKKLFIHLSIYLIIIMKWLMKCIFYGLDVVVCT